MVDLTLFASFVAVVQEGSISAGARRRGITQPAMTRQIQRLEHDLGVRLLVRGNGPLRTTPAGARFYDRATDLLALAENVVGQTKQEAAQIRSILHVIAPPATISSVVAPYLIARGETVPLLDCDEAEPFRVFDVAATRGADLGVSTAVPRPGWRRCPISSAVIWAHVPPGHELAARPEIDIAELVRHPLIVLTPNSAARQLLDQETAQAGRPLADPLVVRHPAIAAALVVAGRGIAVLTDDPGPDVVAIPIRGASELLQVPLYAGWDPDNPRARLVEEVALDLGAFFASRTRARRQRATELGAGTPAAAPDAASRRDQP
ncbi:LysR family transcriptional regulator [Streptomyces sp. NPDC021098]|uniref:LysR family transcriptional regulator n=1 Tax=unclassified Streptomyces TaxID=2593676 RepID=UPI0037AA774C